jgi:hypothetical protein
MNGMGPLWTMRQGALCAEGWGTARVLLVPAICLASQLRQVGHKGPGAA